VKTLQEKGEQNLLFLGGGTGLTMGMGVAKKKPKKGRGKKEELTICSLLSQKKGNRLLSIVLKKKGNKTRGLEKTSRHR